ncbi:ferritin family protein [Thermus filiformis]|jgi:rubrerythrin|uniref:Heat-stable protein n=1 Tax=Thermus filiformis TaxID=276 RepID=A0A0A2X6Z3_THEFI|nr:ferritin family protein [Thermus filiformis]KGQ21009.1 heat-stable protein [Thermus filiformis]
MTLAELLTQAYLDELRDALRAEEAARRIPYPHLRARLEAVAQRERAHAEALAEAMRKRGLPLPPPPAPGEESWQALLDLLSSEGFDRALYLESTLPDPELEALFTRIGQEEKENQEAIRQVVALLG